jgi:rubrerythrin
MDPTELGTNRTGTQMSPRHFRAMQEGVEAMTAAIEGGGGNVAVAAGEPAQLAIANMRADYLHEAEPLGSVPVPGTLKGAARSGADMLAGTRLQALVDRLGERLAFERAGTRMYEALIAKARIRTDELPDVSVATLETFRDQEADHFAMLVEALRELGADPTAQTPGADLAGIEGMGLLQAVVDPRTSLAQSLHAVLAAELVDDSGWELLVAMTREAGHAKLAERFGEAVRHEAEHLATIKRWYGAATLDAARVVKGRKARKTH